MNSIDFIVGEKTYQLSLTTRSIVLLERQLGCNPISIFLNGEDETRIPSVTEMVNILHASLQRFHHGIDMNTAYSIFDDYLADGHSITDFIPVLVDLFKVSGIMPKDDEPKNE